MDKQLRDELCSILWVDKDLPDEALLAGSIRLRADAEMTREDRLAAHRFRRIVLALDEIVPGAVDAENCERFAAQITSGISRLCAIVEDPFSCQTDICHEAIALAGRLQTRP